jgi:hypothetical protein
MDSDQGYLFTYEVSDEAIEVATQTGYGAANFTLGSCTGLSECPGEPERE